MVGRKVIRSGLGLRTRDGSMRELLCQKVAGRPASISLARLPDAGRQRQVDHSWAPPGQRCAT